MSRFTMALVAAATAAVAAIAVVALPAVGDDSGGSNDVDQFAACLRAHGLAGAPNDPMALKPWILRKQASDPAAVKAALDACNAQMSDKPAVTAPGPDIQDVIACVRKHGLDAPTDPVAFKQWIASQESANPERLHAALRECKLALDPGAKDDQVKPGTCGSDETPADKAKREAAPADKAKPEAAPADQGST